MAAKCHMTLKFSDKGLETERIRFHLGSLGIWWLFRILQNTPAGKNCPSLFIE